MLLGIDVPPLPDLTNWPAFAFKGSSLFALNKVGLIYLLVFQITLGRTLGMRLMRMRIIDVYGERPSPARCLARPSTRSSSSATTAPCASPPAARSNRGSPMGPTARKPSPGCSGR